MNTEMNITMTTNSVGATAETIAEAMTETTVEAMAESIPGRFRVCISDRSIHDAALELSAHLTEGGEPLLILDAFGCFQPSHISRCAPHSAGLLHVIRTTASQPVPEALGTLETLGEIWSRFQTVQRDLQARQILVVGVLDRLYDPEILTRDAARTLGGIKYKLEQLAKDGFDVTVLCESPNGNLGTRAHFLSSLCASADQVSNPRSN
jgi:hypothetical protein